MSFIIAIDGPSGTGKSSVARTVAKDLKFAYVDTGVHYRLVAYVAHEKNILLTDEVELAKICENISIETKESGDSARVFVDGHDVTMVIHTEEIGGIASIVSALPLVRKSLLAMQRRLGQGAKVGAVVVGRDIGTVVFPDADVKIFLTADDEARAQRRFRELTTKGEKPNFPALLSAMQERDKRDRERAVSPLVPAKDALVIDTTNHTKHEVIVMVETEIKNQRK